MLAAGETEGLGGHVRGDRDALLHCLRSDVSTHAGAAVHSDDYSALEHEAEGGGAVQELDVGLTLAVLERSS